MNSIRQFPGLLAVIFSLFIAAPAFAGTEQNLTVITSAGPVSFTVETARTEADKERGLMYRTSLAPDHGMLFYWDKPTDIYMWMKNTKIALDMLFIDESGHVVYIAREAEPDSTTVIGAGRKTSAVLELAGGAARADDIHIGDRVVHAYFSSVH